MSNHKITNQEHLKVVLYFFKKKKKNKKIFLS